MELNDNIIRITGTASILKELIPGKEYKIELIGDCISKEQYDRQDGTFDYRYKVKLIIGKILNEEGDVMSFKDRRSNSQKYRALVLGKGYDYDGFMAWLFNEFDNHCIDYDNR